MKCSCLVFFFFFLYVQIDAKTVFVRRSATGNGDGTSWGNAKAFSSFSSVFSGCTGGDTIYLRADDGVYTASTTINLNQGNITAGKRIKVIGVDVNLNPAYATLLGSRKNWTLPADPEVVTDSSTFGGNKLFEVRAQNWEMSYINFVNVGFVYAFNRNFTDINVLLENIKCYNVRSFVDQDASVGISNIQIRNVDGVGYSKKFIRFQGDTNNFLIENVIGNSGRQAYDNFANGICLDGRAHDGIIRNCYMLNGYDNQNNGTSGTYWNGDGYSSERGNYNLLFENCRSSGWTDGGHDHKAEQVTLVNCTSWDNKRNFRLWGRNTNTVIFYNINSTEPRNRGGSGGQSHLYLDDNSRVTVYGGRFKHDSNKTKSCYLTAGANLTLVSVTEIYGPSVPGPQDYKEAGAQIYRVNGTIPQYTTKGTLGTTSTATTTGSTTGQIGTSGATSEATSSSTMDFSQQSISSAERVIMDMVLLFIVTVFCIV